MKLAYLMTVSVLILGITVHAEITTCLLYTSDAADE